MKKKQRMLAFAVVITATSQFYLNFAIDGFRISTAVIILPVFLIMYDDISSMHTSVLTALIVFIVRIFVLSIRGVGFVQAFYTVFPGSLFYVIYGIIFSLNKRIPNKSLPRMFFFILTCDFSSNIIEVFVRIVISNNTVNYRDLGILFLIAATRAFLAVVILAIILNYRILLTREEHEVRYQNLILLISDLKSEIYLMKKNSDAIEHIMTNSYTMYENLLQSGQDDYIKDLSLNITKDIHEIKKDYILVIKGLESTLTEDLQLSEMSIKDIFYILKKSVYRSDENENLYLDFKYSANFSTKNHFQLMSILRNLVNNSMESMDFSKKNNYIKIYHKHDKKNHIFIVSDSGEGISQENLKYIYNPGFSTKFDYNTGDVNRGIGLYHVKNLVEGHFKGTIAVTSKINLGTEFTIKIPILNMEGKNENIHY
ncbi:sensor histidine kinase [Sedimentibacter hydroxybenzoicus DSM 7310]|uniref:histidine kinase n=1 Tax=Sedimentibacter hydroxybenzoicus DSM 7310 TaxID=1123245 RepID=A0A974BII1_SEDHY|nr:sensor histidine kinase [Sedimentibacter hydroxybenzoicus]NYB73466.1 sensor histidine kinase [Sedimentibacter hydroxybenzoicus DSM 7310]